MALPQELVAPIAEDLRVEALKFEIVKGIEHINYIDGKLASGNVEEGDWVVKTASGFSLPGSASAKSFPVVTGNNRYDALATGNVTVVVGGDFIYKTTKFKSGGSYTVGAALTVKGSESVPQLAAAGDIVCGRVWSYDSAKGVMEVLVINQ